MSELDDAEWEARDVFTRKLVSVWIAGDKKIDPMDAAEGIAYALKQWMDAHFAALMAQEKPDA